jgi:hypothetical protein
LLVGTLASSAKLCASSMLTLCAFLLVTMTILPSGDGSTLYAPAPVGTDRTSANECASRTCSVLP